jgi:hypothetical protein
MAIYFFKDRPLRIKCHCKTSMVPSLLLFRFLYVSKRLLLKDLPMFLRFYYLPKLLKPY